MADIIQSYLADPNVPVEKRRKLAAQLNAKEVDSGTVIKGITAKYGNKYGTPQTPQEKLGGDIAKKVLGAANPSNLGQIGMAIGENALAIAKGMAELGSRQTPEYTAKLKAENAATEEARNKKNVEEAAVLQGLNKRGIVPEAAPMGETEAQAKARVSNQQNVLTGMKIADPIGTLKEGAQDIATKAITGTGEAVKTGVLKGAEGVQEVGAAVTGNTDSLEGFRSFYGLKSPEQAAADMKQLSPAERGFAAGEGVTKAVGGTLATAFSPITGTVEAVPGGKEALGAVGGVLSAVSQTGSEGLKSTLKASGVNLTPEQEAVIDEGMSNVLNLMLIKSGEDVAKVKQLEAVKMKAQAEIPKLIKAGDFEAAQALMKEYEAANSAATTVTGRTGAALEQGTKDFLGKTAGGVGAVAAGTTEAAGKVAKGALEKTGKFGESIQSKISGLDVETIKTLKNLPDEYKQAVEAGGVDTARVAAFKPVKSLIDTKLIDLKSTGKTYQNFQNATVKIGNYLNDKLSEAGLEIGKNGKLKATSESTIRSAGDVNKVQSLWDMYKNKDVLTGKEYLNLRSDIADVAKFDQATTQGARLWAKDLYANLNSKFRKQVEGLEATDAASTMLRKELKSVKGLIYDAKGDIKPNAISTINNLFNKGKEGKLAALEELMPNFDQFKQQVRIGKALEDVQRASSVKVGTYANGLLAGGSGFFLSGGNPMAAFAGMVLSNPAVFTELLIKYGQIKKGTGRLIDNIRAKIIKGDTLTKAEGQFAGEMISYYTDQGEASMQKLEPKPIPEMKTPLTREVGKNAGNLETEAMKYKTPEEFVQDANTINPSLHGVFEDYAPTKRASMPLGDNLQTLQKTVGGSADDMVTIYRGTSSGNIVAGDFVTTNKQLAQDYAGNGKVAKLRVRKGDVVDMVDEAGGGEYLYRPFADKEPTYTKSELTDIWNKARRPKGELSKEPAHTTMLFDNSKISTEVKGKTTRGGTNYNPTTLEEHFAEGVKAKPEIDAVADKIAAKYNAKVAKAPIKKFERGQQKVNEKYNGDFLRLQDIARNTIVATEKGTMPQIFADLQKTPNFLDAEVKKASNDALGYSGINTRIKSSSGHIGETQINTPEMIYAKEKPVDAKAILGEPLYNKIVEKTGVEGGKGHLFYEKWRDLYNKTDEVSIRKRKKIEKESKAYYNSIRAAA